MRHTLATQEQRPKRDEDKLTIVPLTASYSCRINARELLGSTR